MVRACLTAVLLIVCGCGAGGKPSLEVATAATIQAADLAYGLSVEACDAKEKLIIGRVCPLEQTPEQCETRDREDMMKVREVCDKIYAAFEGVRKATPALKQLSKLEL